MHIRLRLSSSKTELSVLMGPMETEEKHPHLQKLLDDEIETQLQHSEETLQDIAAYAPVVRRMPFPLLIIEWWDLGHSYIFKMNNGVGQWYYSGGSRNKMIMNHFFAGKKLAPVTVSVFRILVALKTVYGNVLHVDEPLETTHTHHFINIWTQLNVEEEREENESFTRMMVCGNTKLMDLFHVMCGSKAREERFCVMPMRWEDGVLLKGMVYSYQRAAKTKATIKDLKWPEHMWLWPCTPYDSLVSAHGSWNQWDVHGFKTTTYR